MSDNKIYANHIIVPEFSQVYEIYEVWEACSNRMYVTMCVIYVIISSLYHSIMTDACTEQIIQWF